MIIIIWVIAAFIVALIVKDKKIGGVGGFFVSLLLSPVLGLIIGLLSGDPVVAPIKKIRCDGCRELIDGDFIVIRPSGTQDKYDYCSPKCRDDFHGKYMKEKGIDWEPKKELEVEE